MEFLRNDLDIETVLLDMLENEGTDQTEFVIPVHDDSTLVNHSVEPLDYNLQHTDTNVENNSYPNPEKTLTELTPVKQQLSNSVTDKDITELVINVNDNNTCNPRVENEIKGKKRKRREHLWKQNVKIKENVSGKSRQQKRIPDCRCKCRNKVNKSDQDRLLKKFNSMSTHTEQNIFLQGCLEPCEPKRHRPRKNDEKTPARPRRVFKYTVLIGSKQKVNVCLSAFTAIFGIKRDRLIAKVQHPEKPISDGRGRHGNQIRTSTASLEAVRKFIASIPTLESHYCRSESIIKRYLDPKLTIRELHTVFCHDNCNINVSYEIFRRIFNEDFNLSFGLPKKDLCNVCTKFRVEIESTTGKQKDDLILQRDQHHESAEYFFEKMKSYKTSNELNSKTLSICFDFQKNLPLPVTNTQNEYYKRQLWLYNFGIQNIQTKSVHMYVYAEHFATKGPDEVITCLDHFIEQNKTEEMTELVIFCDNCYSQNKNRFLFAYLDQLCVKMIFKKVEVIYPVPGHSMMPIDSNFGAIEKMRVKYEKVYCPEVYIDMIRNSRKTDPFNVVFLEHSLRSPNSISAEPVIRVKNYKDYFDAFTKSIPKISKTRHVTFACRMKPKMYIAGTWENFVIYKYATSKNNITEEPLHKFFNSSYLPIKKQKYNDIQHLLSYIPSSYHQFYKHLRPTDDENEAIEEVE